MDEAGQFVPGLVKSWKQDGDRAWVFDLVDNAVFHNGEAFTAKDVAFTFNRLLDAKNVPLFEFAEVESGMYESERKGEGLYFMQTQAALKAEIRSPEQIFGEWKILRELDKPLCRLTLSDASGDGETYKIVVKPGCDARIAGFGLTTWRLDREQLVLTGRAGTWRFAESDPTTWERMPLTTDPLLLMKQ